MAIAAAQGAAVRAGMGIAGPDRARHLLRAPVPPAYRGADRPLAPPPPHHPTTTRPPPDHPGPGAPKPLPHHNLPFFAGRPLVLGVTYRGHHRKGPDHAPSLTRPNPECLWRPA